MKYQHLFNEQLRNSVRDDQGLSTQVKKVLHLSKESIYRRLRNETAYTLDELAALARFFKISLDNLILDQDPKLINMFCHPIFHESGVFSSYIDRINGKLRHLAAAGGELVLIASDLPISQAFTVPELRNFKSYYWQKVILNRSRLKGIQYSSAFYLGDVNRSIDTLVALSGTTDRIEIWTEETIDATIRQVAYCDQSGLFESNADKERVVQALIELLNSLENKLELATAGSALRYQFFISSMELPNDLMLFRYSDHMETFINFSVFNSITSTNHAFCNEIEMLVESIIRKSVNISGQSDIHRHRFFENIRKKLLALI